MHVCMHVCFSVCIYLINVCMYVCMYVCLKHGCDASSRSDHADLLLHVWSVLDLFNRPFYFQVIIYL